MFLLLIIFKITSKNKLITVVVDSKNFTHRDVLHHETIQSFQLTQVYNCLS